MRLAAAFAAFVLAGCFPVGAEEPAIIVQGPGAAVSLTVDDIARLPVIQVIPAFGGAHGAPPATFEGPLLWTILGQAHAVDPDKHRDQVRQTILLTGRDGYTAILALGEIAPEFEGKQVILAERMDGKPLDHLRVVVPGDHRGGRSVHDLARITVIAAPGG